MANIDASRPARAIRPWSLRPVIGMLTCDGVATGVDSSIGGGHGAGRPGAAVVLRRPARGGGGPPGWGGRPCSDARPGWALARLAEAAREEELPAGRAVLHQHDRTLAVHLLLA